MSDPRSEEHCGICLQGEDGDEILRKFSCSHTFHDSCYTTWYLSQSNTIHQCLYCFKNVSNEITQTYDWRKLLTTLFGWLSIIFSITDCIPIFLALYNIRHIESHGEHVIVLGTVTCFASAFFKIMYPLGFLRYIIYTMTDIEIFSIPHNNESISPIIHDYTDYIEQSLQLWCISVILYLLTKLHEYYYPPKMTICSFQIRPSWNCIR